MTNTRHEILATQTFLTEFLEVRRGQMLSDRNQFYRYVGPAPNEEVPPAAQEKTAGRYLDRRGGDLETALEILDDRVLALEGRIFIMERKPK